MTASGTYGSFLAEGDLVCEVFDRCGIRSSEITREKMSSCKRSFNLEMQSWSVKGINLWAIEPLSVPLIAGTSTYTLPAYVISVLEVYVSQLAGSVNTDLFLTPISRTEYAMQANKATQARPTTYWFNRQTPQPLMVMWPVPDQTGIYTLNMNVMRQLQDVNMLGTETVDAPYRFQDALCAGVAKRLAVKFAPSKYNLLKAEAEEAYGLAGLEDRERADMNLTPILNNYFRGT